MYKRTYYLNKLLKNKDSDIIKIITGVRRCGKSTLLLSFIGELKKTGKKNKNIIFINLEDPKFTNINSWESLYAYINNKLEKNKKNYIFIDEVQEISNFEKAVNGLFLNKNNDIYLTGSNAKMLSSEISTLLSGRYIEINISPFSLFEFNESNNIVNNRLLDEYFKKSSFPYLSFNNTDPSLYLKDLYNTVINKDIVKRLKQKNKTDVDNIVRYLCSVIGSETSTNNISNYLRSNKISQDNKTVSNIIEQLLNCYLFHKVYRFNIRGKEILKNNSKYYIVDIALKNYLTGNYTSNFGHNLENVVFLELRKMGHDIFIGNSRYGEIDFVQIVNGNPNYFQVSTSILDETVKNREIKPLSHINDNFPKTILTLDTVGLGTINGIEHKNIVDWCLGNKL